MLAHSVDCSRLLCTQCTRQASCLACFPCACCLQRAQRLRNASFARLLVSLLCKTGRAGLLRQWIAARCGSDVSPCHQKPRENAGSRARHAQYPPHAPRDGGKKSRIGAMFVSEILLLDGTGRLHDRHRSFGMLGQALELAGIQRMPKCTFSCTRISWIFMLRFLANGLCNVALPDCL